MTNKDFIYEYWSHTELGKQMIASDQVSESDLLFLMPNNIKRRHGLPLTRVAKRGRKKRKYKGQRKRFILSFKLFELISETIDETIYDTWKNSEFFDKFVDSKKLSLGDKNLFAPDVEFDGNSDYRVSRSRKILNDVYPPIVFHSLK